ncbi:site-specific integrase [Cellulomonas sp. APG4]|uniref:site-specific integrase n=1 Tax=Cellulomonas sp. APG4 TaxID=1538656 RepID=UPI00137B5C0C|nr:tyrosine-type recombinase/integrase [Cellulomonas sp. APG4]NCT90134.1 site-specific integrase [Cellulomonas sp. APG4]
MARPKVTKTAVKNAPGIRRITRSYEDGRKVEKYEVRVKDALGKDVSLGMFATLTEARAAQVNAKSAQQKGSFVAPSAGKATFLSVAEDWLASPQVVQTKPRTRRGYELLVHGRLRPLHGVNVNRLTHKELSRFVASLTADGLAPATVRHVTFVLRRVLDEAVSQQLVASNPMASVRPPKLRTVQPYVLTEGDVGRLIDHLRTHDDQRWWLLVMFAAYTGCRAGEIAGLRVRHLNLLSRTVRIESVVHEMGGRQIAGSPKTDAGLRTISGLPRALCDGLGAHVAQLRPDDYVFGWLDAAGTSHPYRHANFLRRVFTPAVEAVGLPTHRTRGGIGLHDLRHFHASLCIERGMTPVQVAKRLGHVNATLVLRTYAHAWQQDDSKWGDVFDASLAAAQEAASPSNVVPLAR